MSERTRGLIIRLENQRNEYCCGIACAAMVANRSLDEMKNLFKNLFEPRGDGQDRWFTTPHQLQALLKNVDIESTQLHFTKWPAGLDACGILAVKSRTKEVKKN